jgi:transcriptional regulator with XRE-family HTH domain
MSELVGISPSYYCDIEKGRIIPPEHKLEKILSVLNLSKEDELTFFDLAAKKTKKHISLDLPEYIMENEVVLAALRLAKDKAVPEDWHDFIEKLNSKE